MWGRVSPLADTWTLSLKPCFTLGPPPWKGGLLRFAEYLKRRGGRTALFRTPKRIQEAETIEPVTGKAAW